MLEIGCATGIFLDVARRKGWQVAGVEISDFAGQYAREKLGLEVFIGQLEDSYFPPESFDVICMFHLLEHIPSPKKFCQIVHRLLKPDGLVVIEIPDFSSSSSRRFKEKWGALQPETHLYHFSKKTLGNLLNQTGHEIIGISLWATKGTGLLQTCQVQPGLIGLPKRFLMQHFSSLNWLRKGVNFIRTRLFRQYDLITVYARKQ